MDNITHGLTGAGIGLLLSQEVFGVLAEPSLVIAAVAASQLPDVDAIVGARNKTRYLKHHRGFSHSFLTAPMTAAFVALAVGLVFGTNFSLLFLTAFLSLSLHIVLDVFNAYGTKALWPLSQERYAWDVLMVVDPVIILLFGAGIALYLMGYQGLLYMLYPALVIYLLSMVKHRMKAKRLLAYHLQPKREYINIMPPMLGWRKWNFIVEKDDQYYLGKIDIVKHDIEILEVLNLPKTTEQVEYTKADPRVQVFLDFARFPYYSTYQSLDGDTYIRWSDLRYKLREKEHFTLWSKTY